MQNIAEIRLQRLSLPLTVPYKLSFGPVTAFDTVLAHVTDEDERTGLGEATILTGYTPETIDGCWSAIREIAGEMAGGSFEAAKALGVKHHHDAPFTVTALVTALEMIEGHTVLSEAAGADVPLLAILSATGEDDIAAEVRRHADAGYKTIKVKIGWNVEDDLKRTAFIQSVLPDGVSIRIDGNQGYSKEDGIKYASNVAPDNVELLEQPCHMDDWDAAAAVAKVSNVPVMLDESIYGEEEIRRAADLGTITYIKLKLMKAGSLDALDRELRLIRELGMKPVLGNGVAADPGCWMEACVAHRLIDNAGEMNGFLKPTVPIFTEPMRVANGCMRLPRGMPGLIDLTPYILDEASVGGY